MQKKIYNLMTILATIFISTHQLSAQQIEPWKVRRVYINGSPTFNAGGTVQLNMHFNNSWVAYIASENLLPKSKNLPSDYLPSSFNFFDLRGTLESKPINLLNLVSFGTGKVITVPSDKAWIIATGGISVGNHKETKFTRRPVESGSLFGLVGGTSSNYSTTTESRTAIGITAGLEGHVNLFRFMAVSTAAKLLVSNARMYPYLSLGLDIGLMRPNRQNMIKPQTSL
jgi:hypothetical protein